MKESNLKIVEFISLALVLFCLTSELMAQIREDVPADFPAQCRSLCKPAADAYTKYTSPVRGSIIGYYGCSNIWSENAQSWREIAQKNPSAFRQIILQYERTASGDLSQYRKIQGPATNPAEDPYVIARDKINLCVAQHIAGSSSVSAQQARDSRTQTQTNPQPNATSTVNTNSTGAAASSSNTSNQSQQLQAAAQQAQAAAVNVQQRADADAQRRGRRVHDPAAEAHDCLRVDRTGLFGAMVNTCSYKVWFNMCAYKPRDEKALDSGWLVGLNCENQQFGLDSVGPNSRSAMHTKGAEAIHYFACKDPAMPADASFEGGSIAARCRNLGGN